jgi:hypothetical protein
MYDYTISAMCQQTTCTDLYPIRDNRFEQYKY